MTTQTAVRTPLTGWQIFCFGAVGGLVGNFAALIFVWCLARFVLS